MFSATSLPLIPNNNNNNNSVPSSGTPDILTSLAQMGESLVHASSQSRSRSPPLNTPPDTTLNDPSPPPDPTDCCPPNAPLASLSNSPLDAIAAVARGADELDGKTVSPGLLSGVLEGGGGKSVKRAGGAPKGKCPSDGVGGAKVSLTGTKPSGAGVQGNGVMKDMADVSLDVGSFVLTYVISLMPNNFFGTFHWFSFNPFPS